MFTLFQAASRDTRGVCDPLNWKEHRQDYVRVARISCALDRVFEATNSIEKPWVRNPEVVAVFVNEYRSTSVGDVVVDEVTGEVFMCAPVGWEKCGD